jgi:3D (Asp-Asp-Asp) domain-containing protein
VRERERRSQTVKKPGVPDARDSHPLASTIEEVASLVGNASFARAVAQVASMRARSPAGQTSELAREPTAADTSAGALAPRPVTAENAKPPAAPGAASADKADKTDRTALGMFTATSYGPPWNRMQGHGVTKTGVDLQKAPQIYGVAVDPKVIPLRSHLYITPNPFGHKGTFVAFDTGGAIKGEHIDFYDWRGRKEQRGWGKQQVTIERASHADPDGTGR